MSMQGLERDLEAGLGRFGVRRARVRVEDGFSRTDPHLVELSKTPGVFTLRCDTARIAASEHLLRIFAARAPTVLAILARTAPDCPPVIADLGDGCDTPIGDSPPNTLSFSSPDPACILIADHEFAASRGYAGFRKAGARALPWRRRSELMVWRSATTGKKAISAQDMSAANLALNQRTRLCLALRGIAGTDVRYSRVVQSPDEAAERTRLEGHGIFGEMIAPETWAARKFAFDVDGNTNAFSNLFTRLLLGCCVLKVASGDGYRQWFYDDLEPWTHYVPVAADLSDAADIVAWCRAHDAECETIARAGQVFAMQRTLDSELTASARAIDRRLAPAVAYGR